jgi:dGTPase
MLKSMNLLKEWLFEEVYTKYPVLYPDINKAKRMVKMIFMDYVASGAPDGFDGVQGALDYVAGMTDRFAIREFKLRFLPSTFRGESE